MPAPTESNLAMVHTRGDRRSLEFSPGMIQSEMLLSQPDHLVLDYARAMMCFTLFKPRPRHIVMVGLGGGSLLKFCYRHLPEARITVLELRADVIALRQQFMIPPDDARLQVIHTDAASHLRRMQGSIDVLLVDGFDEAGLPPELCSPRFYADCKRALRDDGVLVANIFAYDIRYRAMLHRLGLTFNERICWFNGIAGNNHIVFAVNGAAKTRALRVQRFVAFWHGLGFFNRMLAHLVVRRLSQRR